MIIRPRVLLAILLLIVALQLAACDRLSPPAPVDNAGPGVDLSDPDVGGGVGEDTGPQTPVPTPTVTPENSPRLDATMAAVASFPPPATAGSQPPTAEPATPAPTIAPTAEPPTPPPTALPSATPESSPTSPVETIHVVQPGENLYRIGLIYGLSWVAIAEYNGIVNPDAIMEGQELRIPPAPTSTPEAQSAAPTTDDGPQTAAVEPLTVVCGRPSLAGI